MSTQKKLDVVTPQDYAKYITTTLTKEILKLIDNDEPKFGADWAIGVRVSIVASLVSTMVYRCLTEAPPSTAQTLEEAASISHSGYKGLKEAIEQSIAAGFQGAFQSFSGKPSDYYCQILPVPEPVNELPC